MTTIIIRQCYQNVFRNGLKSTLNELCAKFWIPKARHRVKSVLRKCTVCRRYEAKPCVYRPPCAELPEFRVRENVAFMNISTDLAGPLFTRYTLKDTRFLKVWIVIFTCSLCRAVHLELVENSTTEQFLSAFRRFISRRGTPQFILSDNASNLKRAERTLDYIWFSAIYERLIKTVKRGLKKTLKNSKVTVNEPNTLLTEIECMINNRPLTYQYSDDLEKALTPSHLITGRRLDLLPDLNETELDVENEPSRTLITKRQRHLQKLLKHWWKRWNTDYLINLRDTHNLQSSRKGKEFIRLKEGDVVCILEDKVPRGQWKLGKKDIQVRRATVRIVTPTGKSLCINRSVNKLCPLEVPDRLRRGSSPKFDRVLLNLKSPEIAFQSNLLGKFLTITLVISSYRMS